MDDDDQLTTYEVAQLTLVPAADAVSDFLKTSEAARTHLTDLGIDVDETAVVVYWVGGVLDEETAAAFVRITESTGTPINVVPTRFSKDEFFAAMDDIAASQQGVIATYPEDDEITVKVNRDSATSLSSRPSEILLPGKRDAIPLRYEETEGEQLAYRQNDANP